MTSHSKPSLILALGALLLASMACNLPLPDLPGGGEEPAEPTATEAPQQQISEATATPTPSPQAAEDPAALPVRLERGEVELRPVSAVEEDISGPVLLLQVTNLTDDEVLVTIPCGLVFQPANGDEQRLMVIQPEGITLAPGEQGEMQPYVICIDANRAGPSVGSSYSLGLMATEDLLSLAQCICQEDLAALEESFDFESLLGLQMAVWMTSEGAADLGELFSQLEGEAGGALSDLMGEDLGEMGMDMQQFIDMMEQLMGEPARQWLQKCGLQGDGE